MDIQLPGMDGLQATALLKADAGDARHPGDRADRPGDEGRRGADPRGRLRWLHCEAAGVQGISGDDRGQLVKAPIMDEPRCPQDAWPDTRRAPRCVLIVDDQSHNRELLKVMLLPEGFALLTAASGEEALALLAQQPPDLILLDVMMPGMDGYRGRGKAQGQPGHEHIPIIMVTALDDRAGQTARPERGSRGFPRQARGSRRAFGASEKSAALKIYGDEAEGYACRPRRLNEELDRRTREIAFAQALAGGATARLARLQGITAALGNHRHAGRSR